MDLQCSIKTGIFFIGTLIWEQGSERDSDPEIFGINPLSQILLTRKFYNIYWFFDNANNAAFPNVFVFSYFDLDLEISGWGLS